jgi:tetratricopeptide (TPR) repeat protein
MFGSFSALRLPKNVQAWSLDRSWDRAEGERLLKARDYPAAEGHLAKAVTESEQRRHSVPKRIHLRLELAEAQRKQFQAGVQNQNPAKLDEAEKVAHAALELAARTGDRDAYVRCLDALGDIFSDQGNFQGVEKVMQEAVRLEVMLPHPDPLGIARRVHRLGIARHKTGRSEEAIPALEEAVAVHQRTFGEEHVETAHHLTELGEVYRAQGNHPEAQRCLRRALRIHERACGMESPEAIRDLHHLAGSLEESGDLEGAAAQYERALMFKLRTVGGDLDELAQMQYGLADLYIHWHNYSRAREPLSVAIGAFRWKGGDRLASAYDTLGHVEECSGRYHDAVKNLALAGKVWERLTPERAAELKRNLEHRAGLLDQLRKKGEAAWLRQKVAELAAPPARIETAGVI